jgi:hypothetical protein
MSIPILLGVLLAGCESVGGTAPNRQQQAFDALREMGLARGEPVDRISNFRINGWREINDQYLVITAGVHDHYLVELFAPCNALTSAFDIGIESRTGSALTDAGTILVDDLHGHTERCPIRGLHALEDIPGDE